MRLSLFLPTVWLIVLAALLTLFWLQLPQANVLTVQVLDVGQGDSILIRTPQQQKILIDAGAGAGVLSALGKELGYLERRIDLIVLTHPDADHIGGFSDVLKKYTVGGVLLTGVQHDTYIYTTVLNEITEQGIPVYLVNAKTDFNLGAGVLLDFVWPTEVVAGRQVADTNTTSLVARLTYGATSLLLTGDAERTAEAALLRSPANLQSNLLKLGHHGSNSSSSADFLAAVQSKVALISAGADNRYGHPHEEVLERVADQQILSTAESGTLTFVSDGQVWSTLDK